MKEIMPKELDQVQMGKRIRTQRENLGLTREKLAERLSVSSKFIADIESGTRGISNKRFYLLIQILDVSADYLMKGKDTNKDKERLSLQDGIIEQLRGCTNEQLECMEQIARYYAKGTK